jgi:hypothetical protein
MIVALAFVPDQEIVKMMENLMDYFLNINVDIKLINFLIWFDENYVKFNSYKGKDEKGDVYFYWSVYFNVMNNYPKTSNSIEGWHRSLNNDITHKHPSIYELMERLLKEQNRVEIDILQSLFDHSVDYIEDNSFKKTCKILKSLVMLIFWSKLH